MTINDFIRMAHEAGWQYADGEDGYVPLWDFGKLVEAESAATEREACAKVCDGEIERWKWDANVTDVARAIRARGQA